MKKAILFDFGQTLADSADGFRMAEKEAERELFSFIGNCSWDTFISRYRPIRKAFHERSNFSRKAMWQELCQQCGIKTDARFLQECEYRYWETVEANTRLFPEALDTLGKLSLDYRLGMITNTQGQVSAAAHRLTRFPQLERIFDKVVVAGESGIAAKPDPEPFRICLDALGLWPVEAVFVGDDLRIDIKGAHSAGLFPVWIKHRLVRRSWPEVEMVVPVISSLDELLTMKWQ